MFNNMQYLTQKRIILFVRHNNSLMADEQIGEKVFESQ